MQRSRIFRTGKVARIDDEIELDPAGFSPQGRAHLDDFAGPARP